LRPALGCGTRPIPHQDRLWASSVVVDGGWLYLFGTSRRVHVSRAGHLQIALADKRLLVSWNLNSRAASLDTLADPVAATYGPRFAAITIPRYRRR
jgi:hypothetical protein